jgi:type II secretion system protein C
MKKIAPIKWREFLFSLVLFELLILSSNLSSFQEKRALIEDSNYFPAHSLIGVILSKDPASSIAVLKNERDKKITLLKIGESILGMKLVQVFENRIVLQKGKRTFQIFLGQSKLVNVDEKLNRPSPTSVKEPPVAPPMNDQPIIDLPTKEFSRSEVEKRIREEWSLIIQETRFVPNIVDGKISGFKITKLPSKTILTDTGILQNDIIKEVNGIRLNDMRTLFSLFDKFRDESQFEVHVERNGKLYRLFYTLK